MTNTENSVFKHGNINSPDYWKVNFNLKSSKIIASREGQYYRLIANFKSVLNRYPTNKNPIFVQLQGLQEYLIFLCS